MKNKIVLWGTNEKEEKILIALELHAEDNKVMLYTFPDPIVKESFVNDMMDKWRYDKEDVPFPEGFHQEERELSIVESLLPDDVKPERTDLIIRAQSEWQFVVLSSKLYKVYEQELQEFREKVQQLGTYDNDLFTNLKSFWDKVQEQARDRNLLRDQVDNLRTNVDELFADLKTLRKKANEQFINASKGVYEELNNMLVNIEKKIEEKGVKFNSIFDELKILQRRYREARLSNEHRGKLWDRIDAAFKAAKERKFGPTANEGSLVERHGKRLGGLMEAIQRMEQSIKRDEDDLKFEHKKIERTEGQLEAQIRGAKIKMIEERVASKRLKLEEMIRTKDQVERQIKSSEEKEIQRAQKEAERKMMLEAKEKAKKEIAEEIKTRKPEHPEDQNTEIEADNLTSADDQQNDPAVLDAHQEQAAPKSDSLMDAIGQVIGDVVDEALTAAGALAAVAAELAEETIEKVVDQMELVAEAIENVEAREKEQLATPAPELSENEADTPLAIEKAAEAEPVAEMAAPIHDEAPAVSEETVEAEPVEERAAPIHDEAPAVPEETVEAEPVEEIAAPIHDEAPAVSEETVEAEPVAEPVPDYASAETNVESPKTEPEAHPSPEEETEIEKEQAELPESHLEAESQSDESINSEPAEKEEDKKQG